MKKNIPHDDMRPDLAPFTIIIDTREQNPFAFDDIRGDAKEKYRPVIVPTVVRGLKSGDYGLVDHPGVAIERKSHADLFSSLGQGRERFERELERLNQMEFAAVVCESSWRQIIFEPPEHSAMSCKCVMRSILAFSVRYPRVHWFPMGSRSMAERVTYRLLEKFWQEQQKQLSTVKSSAGTEAAA